jgi:transposase
VADSALYSEANLDKLAHTAIKWITRVPATVSEAQVALAHADPPVMAPLQEGYRYHELTSSYGGVEQRWVLIYSEARPPQAQRTADNQLRQQTDKEVKAFKTLCRTPFACEADARQALSAFAQDLQVTFLATSTVRATPRYDQQGRPEKAFNPIRWSTTSTEPWLPRSRLGVALFCWHSLAVSARPMADCTQSS